MYPQEERFRAKDDSSKDLFRLTKKDILAELLIYAAFAAIIYAFYRSVFAFVLLPPACIIYHRYNKKRVVTIRKDMLADQFKDALISISSALKAGYSVENAVSESLSEMRSLYGTDSLIFTELQKAVSAMSLGMTVENAFTELALRCGVDDIMLFASVLSIAKRSGGNLVEIINKTSGDISSKADIKREISVAVSSKRLEQRIMSFMPLCIILYIGLFSPDMIAPLYGNLIGIAIMTVCLGLYIFAFFISLRIMNIEV